MIIISIQSVQQKRTVDWKVSRDSSSSSSSSNTADPVGQHDSTSAFNIQATLTTPTSGRYFWFASESDAMSLGLRLHDYIIISLNLSQSSRAPNSGFVALATLSFFFFESATTAPAKFWAKFSAKLSAIQRQGMIAPTVNRSRCADLFLSLSVTSCFSFAASFVPPLTLATHNWK